MMKNVVFRVDASVLIGSGHVMRCLVLANLLKEKGNNVTFATKAQQGDMNQLIIDRGFDIVPLDPIDKIIYPEKEYDYSSWLHCSPTDDAIDFSKKVTVADLVIVDHYSLNAAWHKRVKDSLNCKICVIDDLVRDHAGDLVIDQSLDRSKDEYNNNYSATILTGTSYALIGEKFVLARERAFDRQRVNGKAKILLSMGGIDQPNATLKVLKELENMGDKFHITVLLSCRAPHYQDVISFCKNREFIQHIDFCDNMAELMLEHDIAIGAPGTTSWERACLGLPNVIIPLADNQKYISKQLMECGASIVIKLDEITTKLLCSIENILSNWNEFKNSNLRICDGYGARRVVNKLEELFFSAKSYDLRIATLNDVEMVFKWQSHSETRKYSNNKNAPSWDEHNRWMRSKLESVTDYFYIINDEQNRSYGVVRLDRIKSNRYLISIFINPDNFGEGIGSQALELINRIHSNMTIEAIVFEENVASRRIFQKAGYQPVEINKFVRTPLR